MLNCTLTFYKYYRLAILWGKVPLTIVLSVENEAIQTFYSFCFLYFFFCSFYYGSFSKNFKVSFMFDIEFTIVEPNKLKYTGAQSECLIRHNTMQWAFQLKRLLCVYFYFFGSTSKPLALASVVLRELVCSWYTPNHANDTKCVMAQFSVNWSIKFLLSSGWVGWRVCVKLKYYKRKLHLNGLSCGVFFFQKERY